MKGTVLGLFELLIVLFTAFAQHNSDNAGTPLHSVSNRSIVTTQRPFQRRMS
jgi:hypothetical protein